MDNGPQFVLGKEIEVALVSAITPGDGQTLTADEYLILSGIEHLNVTTL